MPSPSSKLYPNKPPLWILLMVLPRFFVLWTDNLASYLTFPPGHETVLLSILSLYSPSPNLILCFFETHHVQDDYRLTASSLFPTSISYHLAFTAIVMSPCLREELLFLFFARDRLHSLKTSFPRPVPPSPDQRVALTLCFDKAPSVAVAFRVDYP